MAQGKSSADDPINKENRLAFQRLRASLRSKQLLALVGAGVSAGAGYPTWDQLLGALHKESGAEEGTLRHKDVLWRAQVYRGLLGEEPYRALLKKLFAPRRSPPTELARILTALPFRHFLTTNYDNLIERAHKEHRASRRLECIDWSEDVRVSGFIKGLGKSNQPQACVHIHGLRDRPECIVLTDADYTSLYARTTQTTRKLFAIFATQPVLFIGYSLEDPDLVNLLREVNAALGDDESQHFALLPIDRDKEDPQILRERLRKKFGIDVIFYPSTARHEKLEAVVRLLQESDRERDLQGLPVLHQSPERLPRVRHSVDPEDPQRGQWGGQSKRNGRELRLQGRVEDTKDGWFSFTLEVAALHGKPPLSEDEKVEFHLHDTFADSPRTVDVKRGRAVLPLDAWGGFTVGAHIVGENTKLELDLCRVPGVPKAFREA